MKEQEAVKWLLLLRNEVMRRFDYGQDNLQQAVDIGINALFEKLEREGKL